MKSKLENWLCLGWCLFPAIGLLAPTVQAWKNFFYLMLLLPWALLFCEIIKDLLQEHTSTIKTTLTVVIVSAIYWTASSFWSDQNQHLYIFFIKQVIYLFCYLSTAVYLAKRYPSLLRHTFSALIVGGVISASISVYLYIEVLATNEINPLGWAKRLEGFKVLKNPLVAAQSYGICFLLCVYAGLRQSSWTNRFYLLSLSLFFFVVIFLTRSRGPLLFLFFPTVLIFLLIDTKLSVKALLTAIGMLIGCVAVVLLFPNVIEELISRGLNIDYRMDIWSEVWKGIQQNPIFGIGARRTLDIETISRTYHHAHSIWLETALYTGITGLVALIISYTLFFHKAIILYKRPIYLALLVYGALCLTSNGHFVLSRPGWQWLMLWIPVALILAKFTVINRLRTVHNSG